MWRGHNGWLQCIGLELAIYSTIYSKVYCRHGATKPPINQYIMSLQAPYCDSTDSWQLYTSVPLETRPPAGWTDTPLSHIVLILSRPVVVLSKFRGRSRATVPGFTQPQLPRISIERKPTRAFQIPARVCSTNKDWLAQCQDNVTNWILSQGAGGRLIS